MIIKPDPVTNQTILYWRTRNYWIPKINKWNKVNIISYLATLPSYLPPPPKLKNKCILKRNAIQNLMTHFATMEQILVVRSPLKSSSLISRWSISSFTNGFTLVSFTRTYTSSRALFRIEASESCSKKWSTSLVVKTHICRWISSKDKENESITFTHSRIVARCLCTAWPSTFTAFISMFNATYLKEEGRKSMIHFNNEIWYPQSIKYKIKITKKKRTEGWNKYIAWRTQKMWNQFVSL